MADHADVFDVRQCAAHEVQTIEATEPPNKRYARSAYARQHEGRSIYLVAWRGGEPVGSGEVVFGAPPELKNLNVRAGLRRLGIGTEIVAAAENVARPDGALVIGVSDDNEQARSLYLRLGYRPTGDVEHYRYVFVDDDGAVHHVEESAENLLKPL